MNKKISIFALTAAVFLLISGNAAFAAKVTLKFAHSGSNEHQYHIGAEQFKKLVEERSNKEIIVNIFPQAQLGSERDSIEGVRMGTLEMTAIAAAGALPSFVPETGVLAMPYVLHTRPQTYAILDGAFGQELNKYIEKKGLINLAFWEVGFRHFTNNVKPIKTPADLKGLKIRVQESKVWMELIKTLGGIPAPVSFGELYSALQQKVVDGQENPIATIYSMKYYEVQKYLSLDGHTYEAAAVLVNPKFFNNLSAGHKKIIIDAAKETAGFQRKELEQLDSERLAVIKKAGVTVEEKPDVKAFAEATKDFGKNIDNVPASLIEMFREEAAKALK